MTRVFRMTRAIVHRLLVIQRIVSESAGVKVPMSTIVREVLRRGLQSVEEDEHREQRRGQAPMTERLANALVKREPEDEQS
jgi:hypothetical protein